MAVLASKPRWETPEPRNVAGSYGPQAIAWARRKLGIVPGPWQRYAITQILRYDKRGDLLARIALLSTARQNGKSIVVRIIIGWLLDEGHTLPAFASWTTLLAAAHDAKQARIVYRGVMSDFEAHGIVARLTQYFGIEKDGLLFDVVTAQPGSARGLSAGLIAWDEVLTQRGWDMWEALSPTQSAQRSPLMLLTSTAGTEESILLRSFYDRLVRQASGDEKPDSAFYGAWWQSIDPDAGLDWTQLRQANPAMGDGRLARAAIRSEFALLPRASWQRERLNHWVDTRSEHSAFHPGVWAANRTPEPLANLDDGPWALGIGVAPGWSRATVAVAALRGDGRIGVEVHRDIVENVTPGRVTAVVDDFAARHHPQVIAYDRSSGGAGEFERHGQEAGHAYDGLKPAAMVAATMDFSEMVMAGRLAVDDPLLDHQIPLVVKRMVGADGAYRFSRGDSLGPIDAVEAMLLAAHAIAFTQNPGLH